jgi:hypothetical protein
MELFRRFPSAIFAGNPLAEVHLAAGQRSFLPAS